MTAELRETSPRIDCPMCDRRVAIYDDRRIAAHGDVDGECSASGQLVSQAAYNEAVDAQAATSAREIDVRPAGLRPGEFVELVVDDTVHTLTPADTRKLLQRLIALDARLR